MIQAVLGFEVFTSDEGHPQGFWDQLKSERACVEKLQVLLIKVCMLQVK